MSRYLKKDLAHKLSQCLSHDTTAAASAMKIFSSQDHDYVIHIKTNEASQVVDSLKDVQTWSRIKNNIPIQDIVEYKHGYNMKIEPNYFVRSILSEIISPSYRFEMPRKIIVEYSSPNIAKPFHAGHLRSTIIGQYLANINRYNGGDVVSINYLGDWGTQFGVLQKGIDLMDKSMDEIRDDPIRYLYEAYVRVNDLAKTDPTILDDARFIFAQMEKGEGNIERWKALREVTVAYLHKVYGRLGVFFDEYDWESMYTLKDIQSVLQSLENNKVTQTDAEGRKFVTIGNDEVTIVKTDGSGLYLTRDIAAALDRYERHQFDEMYYVVDNSQSKHFQSLFTVLESMNVPFVKQCKHVPFGRIGNMSSRKGTVVFLNDILDESKERMQQKRLQSPNTRGAIEDEQIADILGISAVKINVLKNNRTKNYDFNWDQALRNDGDTGIRLQYVHCRLWSLEQSCGVPIPTECLPKYLTEKEAVALIQILSQFDETVERSRLLIEPSVLVKYLFQLCSCVNRALKVLRVKDESKDLAAQRLLLFHAGRITLRRGLEILGIIPLNEM